MFKRLLIAIKNYGLSMATFLYVLKSFLKIDKPVSQIHENILKTEEIIEDVFLPVFNSNIYSAKRSILLIEDNEEVRLCIKIPLELHYHVYEAENGIQGLEIVNARLPDLIISDVIMPEMDGLTFCAKIKNSEHTNHIPIILLTGNVGVKHQVSCLKTGADVYLTKPFNVQALLLNVQNLLLLSEKIQSRFSKQFILEPSKVLIDINQGEFIQKVLNLVEENLANTEFGVHHLASKIGMSSPVFYKKMQFLTGMSVNNFMKSIKLKRAAQLLKQRSLTVYQVAYEVGFKDSKYFSREFRKYYGCSPTEYSIL